MQIHWNIQRQLLMHFAYRSDFNHTSNSQVAKCLNSIRNAAVQTDLLPIEKTAWERERQWTNETETRR